MKPLLVGQAPARSGDGRPFTGASGRRLCSLLDVEDYDDLVHLLDLTNLITRVMPKQGRKGDSFDKALGRRSATRIQTKAIEGGRTDIIAAGLAVSMCFGVRNPAFLTTYQSGVLRIHVLPHPSGINLFWNDQTNVRAASRFLKAIVFDWPLDHPSLGN
jgi:hypothetical protein